MWFIYFYGISTTIGILTMVIIAKSIDAKLKRENLKTKKSTFIEGVSALLPFLVPFINILLVLSVIFNQEKFYEAIKLKSIKIEGES